MLMYFMQRLLLFLCASMLFVTLSADEAPYRPCLLTGRVCNADGEALAEAWVRVKDSHVGCPPTRPAATVCHCAAARTPCK